jgi:ATP-binding cassette subfamily B multidrug efflux pump
LTEATTTRKNSLPTIDWQNTTSTLNRVYRYLHRNARLAITAYLALLGVMALNLAIPQFIRWMIDQGIEQQQSNLLIFGALGLLLLTLVKGVLTYIEGKYAEIASQNVAYDLRNEIEHKLTSLSFSFHDQIETGDLLSRAIQDVERIRFLTGRATIRLLEGVLVLLTSAIILLLMQPRLALLVIATMPLMALQALRFGRNFRPLAIQIQKQLGVLTTRIEQNLRGIKIVKAFAQENAEIAHFNRVNDEWFNLTRRAGYLESVSAPLLLLIANLGMVFIIWYGGILVISGELTLGELVAFTAYLGILVEPVRRLGMIIPVLAIANSSAERIFEILDAVPDVRDAPDAQPLTQVRGRIEFENVSFSYRSRETLAAVLHGVSFETRPGQVVALLGPTGSGKSTIISLIPRFYDPTGGRIMIDGLDTRKIKLNSLRSQIGIVMQETTLFAGTVHENIAFGRPDASEAKIKEAARAAQADDFISQMPQGYETRVGERGVTLSGGQKQRIAIARALLMDPHILILDDATASVDTETERLIQQAFANLMQGRTTFIIAHRLSTVRRADQILVLERGRIAARGTHEELLQGSPLYREIYERQLRPQEGVPA